MTVTRMFSVVSLWTSESSSQGWFFSCHAFRVSLDVKGGATEGKENIYKKHCFQSHLHCHSVHNGAYSMFTTHVYHEVYSWVQKHLDIDTDSPWWRFNPLTISRPDKIFLDSAKCCNLMGQCSTVQLDHAPKWYHESSLGGSQGKEIQCCLLTRWH